MKIKAGLNETESDLQWDEFTKNREDEAKRKKRRKKKIRIMIPICIILFLILLFNWYGHTWGKMTVTVDGEKVEVTNFRYYTYYDPRDDANEELCFEPFSFQTNGTRRFLINTVDYGIYFLAFDIPVNGELVQSIIGIYNTRNFTHIKEEIIINVYQSGDGYNAEVTMHHNSFVMTNTYTDIENNPIYMQDGP